MNSKTERKLESQRLLNIIYRNFKLYTFYENNEIVDYADVWLGKKSRVSLKLENSLKKVLNREERAKTQVIISWKNPIPAPIKEGQLVGNLLFKTLNEKEESLPLYAGEDIEQLGFLDRIIEAFKHLIFGSSNLKIAN